MLYRLSLTLYSVVVLQFCAAIFIFVANVNSFACWSAVS